MTTDDQGEDVTSDTRPRMEPQEALAELGAIVLGQPLGVVLRRIADLVVACIPGADEVSVTLVDGDKTTSAAHASGDP